jgi:hypothetical protein
VSAVPARAHTSPWPFSWEGLVNAALSGREPCDALREWMNAAMLEAQARAVRDGVFGGVPIPEGLRAITAGAVPLP